MTTLLLILLGLFLVLLNALFVAAEFGMVKLRHTRISVIAAENPWRGAILAKIHQQLDAYLSACQLGITLASLGLGWVGEPAFANLLTPLLSKLGIFSSSVIDFIGFIFAFTLLSFLHIVVGELMPKSLAIRQSEQISLWTAVPIYGFYWMMYPIIWLLNNCSNFFLRVLKLDVVHPGEQFMSSEEIKLILRSSQLHGELSPQESSILAHTLELTDLRAIDVMCAYDDMIMLDTPLNKKTLMETLGDHQYSRYPVYDLKSKKVIGLVHVKDLQTLVHNIDDLQPIDLQPLTRAIPKIPYRLPALNLLRQFQGGMPHFALVYNRQGVNIGFVTLDNLLHLVIGVIKDEFHKTRDAWIMHKDGSLTVKGNCPINILERALDYPLTLNEAEEEEQISTLSGLIMHHLGSVPKIGDKIELHDFTAIIEKMHGTRITQARIKPRRQRHSVHGASK